MRNNPQERLRSDESSVLQPVDESIQEERAFLIKIGNL